MPGAPTFTDLTLVNNVGRAVGITELKAALDALAAPGAMTSICDLTLGADQASFDTNTILGGNIPSTYKHLRLNVLLRSDRAAQNNDGILLQFNADTTAANYKTQRQTAASASSTASQVNGTLSGCIIGTSTAAASPAGSFSQHSADIDSYLGTTAFKLASSRGGAYADSTGPVTQLDVHTGIWLSTAAVTRIVVLPQVGTVWKTGSRFTLYGLS